MMQVLRKVVSNVWVAFSPWQDIPRMAFPVAKEEQMVSQPGVTCASRESETYSCEKT